MNQGPTLSTNTLDNIQNMHNQIQQNILQTDAQIKLLSNKIIKHDYDRNILDRLEEHRQYLIQKARELQNITENHRKLQNHISEHESYDKKLRKNLGYEYMQISEEKRSRELQEKRRLIQQEKRVQQFHQKSLENDYLIKQKQFQQFRRVAQEQTNLKMQAKLREKQQIQKEKELYNVSYPSQVQKGNKDPIWQQYCLSFMENQKKMPISYKLKGGVREVSRSYHEIGGNQEQVYRDQQMRSKLLNEEKDSLRSYLQDQILEKNRRNSQEKNSYLYEQTHTSRVLSDSIEGQTLQKMRRKDDQRRYDEQLKMNTKMKSYSSDGVMPTLSKSHNPITNPISFKIGITNPYIIRQFEQIKQKHFGDPNLKLRNLAMIGNNSLVKQ